MTSISDLPNELIHMIYEYLYMYRDVVGLSLTCSQLHNNVPNEQLRVLSIKRMYANINAEINNIKYYIIDYSRYIRMSLLITNDKAVIFKNNYPNAWDYIPNKPYMWFAYTILSSGGHLTQITYNDNIKHKVDSSIYVNIACFHNDVDEIHATLIERNIKNSCIHN